MKTLKKLFYPAARYAFKKAIGWGTLGAKIAAGRISNYLVGVLQGLQAAKDDLVRIIDESGEDYAFEAERFHLVSLPSVVEKALLAVSHSYRRTTN